MADFYYIKHTMYIKNKCSQRRLDVSSRFDMIDRYALHVDSRLQLGPIVEYEMFHGGYRMSDLEHKNTAKVYEVIDLKAHSVGYDLSCAS